jgi:multicomponent Na+:H+ antiporter subunit C
VLAVTAALLCSIGTYLVLQRKLSRIIIGIGLLGHGANVLFVISGRSGTAPLIGSGDPEGFSDPLPEAMVLTAIVITFGVTAFLLALAYRSWLLTEDDEVEDDVSDRTVARGGFFDEEVDDASMPEEQPEAFIGSGSEDPP